MTFPPPLPWQEAGARFRPCSCARRPEGSRSKTMQPVIAVLCMSDDIHSRAGCHMPMIDVYASAGTFDDPQSLATELAHTLMTIEQVPDIPMFRQNTAAF